MLSKWGICPLLNHIMSLTTVLYTPFRVQVMALPSTHPRSVPLNCPGGPGSMSSSTVCQTPFCIELVITHSRLADGRSLNWLKHRTLWLFEYGPPQPWLLMYPLVLKKPNLLPELPLSLHLGSILSWTRW